VNDASPKKPFTMPQLWSALALVSKGCWMAKGDVSRFYHSFPIAQESRWLFACVFLGVLYQIVRCTFGYRLCPYYCSTFSAEFGKWLTAYGVPAAWMMDDWFTAAPTQKQVLAQMATIKRVIESTGLHLEAEKDGLGQQMVFLGVLIDSVTMRLSFEPLVAKAFHAELLTYVQRMEAGEHIPQSTCARVAGKMEWYSQVLHEGRMNIDAWHKYAVHGEALSAHGRVQVLLQSAFWLGKLSTWSRGEQTTEFPILSSSELKANPARLQILQSDISGPHGLGYYHGSLADKDYPFYAMEWDGDEWDYHTSHTGELKAPLHFLRHTKLRDVVLVWLTDCLAAAFSVNKGRCYEDIGRVALAEILRLCDEKGIQIVALWLPRERNECADFLSHLAFSMCR
jgi:hypothetical protein